MTYRGKTVRRGGSKGEETERRREKTVINLLEKG